MYHGRFNGNHYEIGFKWGSRLANHGNYILNNIPFKINEERISFGENCLPVYQEFFPEILNEIQGIADSQACDAKLLRGLLFSIYAMPPACNCSCFAVVNEKNILLGRNSDFLTSLEKNNLNVIYRFTSDSYDFTGNTTAFVQMEDGINENGLAIGLTSVYPSKIKPGINAGLLLRFFLEKCKSIEDVVSWINKIPVSSSQTFTVADSYGKIAVIESCCDKVITTYPSKDISYVCATNQFHASELSVLNNTAIDDWNAAKRYQTLNCFLSKQSDSMNFEKAKNLLSGKYGFICQYNRSTGKDTVWSVIYDISQHKIYRTEKNPMRSDYKIDNRFKF